MMRAFALLALLGATAFAPAQEPGQTQWKVAAFTWVKRVPAESGVPANQHPARLTDEALAAALGSFSASVEGGDLPLFTQEELEGLLRPLRDENLLSEAEYQEKREAILKTL